MPIKKLTKWTPELREIMFKYKGRNTWDLDAIIKETDVRIKSMRTHGGSGTLEEINYLKAKKQAAQEELNRIIDYHGKEAVNKSLLGTSTYSLRAPIILKVGDQKEDK